MDNKLLDNNITNDKIEQVIIKEINNSYTENLGVEIITILDKLLEERGFAPLDSEINIKEEELKKIEDIKFEDDSILLSDDIKIATQTIVN